MHLTQTGCDGSHVVLSGFLAICLAKVRCAVIFARENMFWRKMGLLIWPRDARSAYVSITRTDTQSHRADLSLLYFGWVCTPARVDELQNCGLLQPGSSSGFQCQSCSGHFSAGGAPAHVRLHTLHAVHPGTITHPIHCHTPALSSAPPCPFAALQIQQATFVVKLSSMTLTVVVGPAAGRNLWLSTAAPPLLERLRTKPGRPAPHPL